MKRKLYRATIINEGKVTTMIVGGYNKIVVKKYLIDFFIQTKQIKDFKSFEVYLKRVVRDDGNYIEIE